MNKLKIITLGLLVLLASCGTKNPVPDLPPYTETGLNTFGCIADGEVYTTTHNPKVSTDWNCYPKCEFIETGFTGQRINATNCGEGTFASIYIYIYSPLEEGKTYILGNEEGIMKLERGNPNYNNYRTNDEHTSTLHISKLTPTIIAGTFSGTAIGYLGSDSGKVIKIEDGRFDILRN